MLREGYEGEAKIFLDRLGWLIFMLPFCICLLGAELSPGWGRGPELVSSAFSLNLAGDAHPLLVLLGHGLMLLPVGSLSFRLTIATIFFISCAFWFAYQAGVHLLRLVQGRALIPWSWRLMVFGFVLGAGLSSGVSWMASQPGSFGFYLAMSCAFVERALAWCCLPSRLRWSRGLGMASLAWLFAFLAAPGQSWLLLLGLLLLLWRMRCELPPRGVLLWSGAGWLGLVALFWLWSAVVGWRAATEPLMSSSEVGSTRHYAQAHHIMSDGISLRKGLVQPRLMGDVSLKQGWSVRLFQLMGGLVSALGWPVLVLGLWGLVSLCRSSPWLGGALGLWGVGWALGVSLSDGLGGWRVVGRLFLLFVLAWSLSLLWVGWWVRLEKRWRLILWGCLGGGLVSLLAIPQALPCSLRSSVVVRRMSKLLLASPPKARCALRGGMAALWWSEWMGELLPRNALVILRKPQQIPLLQYSQWVERQRPDVVFLSRETPAARAFSRLLRLRQKPSTRLVRMLARRDRRFLGELRRLARQRPICFVWSADLPDWVARTSYPTGLLSYWDPENPLQLDALGRAVDDDLLAVQQRRFWRHAYGLLGDAITQDPMVRRLLLLTHRGHADALSRSHRWKTARIELRYALRLAPKDRRLLVIKQQLQGRLLRTKPASRTTKP